MIRFASVAKSYGDLAAVRGLDLHVPGGTLFGFLGPNGAGKSTTIRMLTGLLTADAGTIEVGGHDVAREPVAAKQIIGYVPDEPALYEHLTGREFIRFAAALWRVDPAEADERMGELLERFDLHAAADDLVETYSRGMRQKLSVVGALVHAPRLLVLDEPMVGLDPAGARALKDLLRTHCDRGGTVFFSTHVLEVAERLCDSVGVIDHGSLVAVGTPGELRARGQEGDTLEDVFLRLTSADETRETDLPA